MATLVCFHAHPDDEAISTGGTMALAAEAGHRVVLVLATRGEQGEPVEGVLAEGEQLWERRVVESQASAELLGVHRIEFLGYEDSGMIDEPTNQNPACFWQADVHEAATRLAAILQEEGADVLTIYDDHGGYGHPDHIQVNRVGTEAAALASVDNVYWATMNRTRIIEQMEQIQEFADSIDGDPDFDAEARKSFGMPEEDLTHAVDVSSVVDRKRQAMKAHASQISEEDFFLAMPEEAFAMAFGTEWFHDPRAARNGGAFLTSVIG